MKNLSINIASSLKKLSLFNIIFIGMFLIQFTEASHVLGFGNISALFNFIVLAGFSAYILLNIFSVRHIYSTWAYFIYPGLIVFFSYLINFTSNSFQNFQLISYFGNLTPWVVLIAAPFLFSRGVATFDKLIRTYYNLMLFFIVAALLEYALLASGMTTFTVLELEKGTYLSGIFSLLHQLEDGSHHYRMYSVFSEPGTLAMAIIPALIFSIVHKKYISVIVFILSIAMTDSLGGYIGLAILSLLLPAIYLRRAPINRRTGFRRSVVMSYYVVFFIVSNFAISGLQYQYNEKGLSRDTRADNVVNIIQNLPSIILEHPLGMNLSESISNTQDKYYFGSNFNPGTALYYGGFLGLIGYLWILLLFFFKSIKVLFFEKISKNDIIAAMSIVVLITFIVQRTAISEHGVLMLIFSLYIHEKMRAKQQKI